MKAENVTVEETRNGGLKVFVQDDSTDSLVVLDLYYLTSYVPQHLCVSTMIRGNYSGSMRYGAEARIVRRAVRANVHVEAPPVKPDEMERRKAEARRVAAAEKELRQRNG